MKQKRLILCRSQSEAMILSRKLSACGIDGKLTRPPRSAMVRSCSWAIEMETRDCARAEDCLSRADISPDIWRWEECET
ncbi:MAG: DUF3343 domain-containing protein [Eubacteriales bacterium]|nr:DUF3343 domain-containing protein [Eubacteriales bacterium]